MWAPSLTDKYCIEWSYTGEIKSEIPARTALFRPGRHKIPGRAESNARFIQCRVEQAGVEGLRRVCRFEERRAGGSAHAHDWHNFKHFIRSIINVSLTYTGPWTDCDVS